MKERKVLYPGSFDPVTLGHMDIIERASQIFEKVILGVAVNTRKKPLLSDDERLMLLQQASTHLSNVTAVAYQSTTVAYAGKIGAHALIRGLRNPSDFQLEFQMAVTNRTLNAELETIFFPSSLKYTFINSGLVREIAASGGDITPFVPKQILPLLQGILQKRLEGA